MINIKQIKTVCYKQNPTVKIYYLIKKNIKTVEEVMIFNKYNILPFSSHLSLQTCWTYNFDPFILKNN